MTLLQRMARKRAEGLERLRLETREGLRAALGALIPGTKVLVFGSLVKPAGFREKSDIDLALFSRPAGMSEYRLQSLLEEQLGRPVDVVLVSELPFAEKVIKEGEVWTS